MTYTQLVSQQYGRQDRHTRGAGIFTNDRGQTYVEATWNDRGYLVYASVPAETVTVEVVQASADEAGGAA